MLDIDSPKRCLLIESLRHCALYYAHRHPIEHLIDRTPNRYGKIKRLAVSPFAKDLLMPRQILPIPISISTQSTHMQSIAAQPAVRNARLSRQRAFTLRRDVGRGRRKQ